MCTCVALREPSIVDIVIIDISPSPNASFEQMESIVKAVKEFDVNKLLS